MALDLADHLFAALPELRVHPTAKRIRAMVDGTVVVDSTRARIVWEPSRIVPSYAVPVADIAGTLTPTDAAAPGAARPVTIGAGPPVLDPGTGFSFHTTPGRTFDITAGPADAARRGVRARLIPTSAATPSSTSTPSTSGGRRTSCSSATPVTRSRRSTPGAARGASSSSSPGSSSPTRPARSCSSRPTCRRGTTCRATTCAWICSCRRDTTTVCAYKGQARYWSATAGDETVRDVAWSYEEPHNYATAVERHGLLLQRARRHHRRRHAAGAAADSLVLTVRRPAVADATRDQPGGRALLSSAIVRSRSSGAP